MMIYPYQEFIIRFQIKITLNKKKIKKSYTDFKTGTPSTILIPQDRQKITPSKSAGIF